MEVSIPRLILMAVLTSFYISGALANPNLNFSSIAMAEDIPFKLNYSPGDYEYGKELINLFNDLSKNQLRANSIKKLITLKGKEQSFQNLNPMLDRLMNVSSINDQDTFYSSCAVTPGTVNEFTESLAQRMDITINKYCRYLFLKRLQTFSSSINLSSRDVNYFKAAAPFYVTGESQSEVSSLLKHFKNNLIEHQKISNILIEKYIELKVKPTSPILINIYVSSDLNLFLQNNLQLDTYSGSFFQEEFQRMVRDSQDFAEKGDFTQAKALIISAITFYNKNKKFIDENKAWNGTILAAKTLYYKGRDSDAVEIMNIARAIAPKDEFSDATFYTLWPYILNKDYKSMKAVIEKNNLEKNYETFDSKLQYWIAYTFSKLGDTKKAANYYNKIINSSPYSFYSIIALKELAALNKGMSEQEILAKLITKESSVELKMDVAGDRLKEALRRLAVWNSIGHERFATLELRYIQSFSKNETFKDPEFAKKVSVNDHKEFIVLNLVRLLYSQEKHITSFKVFQDSLGVNSLSLNYRLIKYIFPLNYLKVIERNANDIDPLIIISLIRQESAFNPEATSRVGAKGLMQLMPATAKRFNKKVKVKHLGNPEINVALGTKYLKQLLTRFDGNLIFALASYNAGENRIDRWKKEIFRNDDPLATIEAIPFEETRNYVKLIYRNKFFYSLLSNRPVLAKPLDETFKVTSSFK